VAPRGQIGPIPRDNVVFELGSYGFARVRAYIHGGAEWHRASHRSCRNNTCTLDIEDEINLVSSLGPATTMLEIAMELI
jgi:hypothetical protein